MTQELETIIAFLRATFAKQGVTNAVVAVSGGIDSAVSLTLTTRALSSSQVFPLLLPHGDQDMSDALAVCEFNQIPPDQIRITNIAQSVASICATLNVPENDQLRRGNIMARTRMIAVYDLAKQHQALVVGTENKSEFYLGYFTRFGDEASDIEPISHLTKTEVRALAVELGIPEQILAKAPSAGLWAGQTDEQELGFSYQDVDAVISALSTGDGAPATVSATTLKAITDRIRAQEFKHHVPYRVATNPPLSPAQP